MSHVDEHPHPESGPESLRLLQQAQDALFRLGYLTLGRQCLSVLIYHSVVPERDFMRPGVPTAGQFKWQMQLLKRHFNVLPLGQAVLLLRDGHLPPRAACVTFDDGYADNLTVAAPIMQQLDIPATFFIATGYLDGGRMWNDTVIETLRNYPGEQLDLSAMDLAVYALSTLEERRTTAYDIINRIKYLEEHQRNTLVTAIGSMTENLPTNLMLTRDQVRNLRQLGMEIGGHTVSHPILARLTDERAREEIGAGKADLERIFSEPVQLFAYPNGRRGVDYNNNHVEHVRDAGFTAAVSTDHGVSDRRTDLLQLPRFTPWDRTTPRFLLRMALNAQHRPRGGYT